MRRALRNLVESGTIRLYDLVVINKDSAGSVAVVELNDSLPDAGGLDFFAGARSQLVDEEDIRNAADAMEPYRTAALIVFENSWAIPFVAAARNSGGVLIASERIPAADLLATLKDLDATAS